MNDTPSEEPAVAEEAPAAPAMSDTPPDRLSVDQNSPWFDGDALARGVGIVFKGTERFNVEEYSVSEGWVRLAMAKTRDRKGNPLTMKMNGVVEPFYRDSAPESEQA